jgi:hypothetical protein
MGEHRWIEFLRLTSEGLQMGACFDAPAAGRIDIEVLLPRFTRLLADP